MDKVTFYQDSSEQWRWTVKAENNEIVAASTEAYHNFADCHQNFLRLTMLGEVGYLLDVCTGEAARVLKAEVEAVGSWRPERPSDPGDLQD